MPDPEKDAQRKKEEKERAQRDKEELDRLKKEEQDAKLALNEPIDLGDLAEERALDRKERKKKLWKQMS